MARRCAAVPWMWGFQWWRTAVTHEAVEEGHVTVETTTPRVTIVPLVGTAGKATTPPPATTEEGGTTINPRAIIATQRGGTTPMVAGGGAEGGTMTVVGVVGAVIAMVVEVAMMVEAIALATPAEGGAVEAATVATTTVEEARTMAATIDSTMMTTVGGGVAGVAMNHGIGGITFEMMKEIVVEGTATITLRVAIGHSMAVQEEGVSKGVVTMSTVSSALMIAGSKRRAMTAANIGTPVSALLVRAIVILTTSTVKMGTTMRRPSTPRKSTTRLSGRRTIKIVPLIVQLVSPITAAALPTNPHTLLVFLRAIGMKTTTTAKRAWS